MAEGDLLEVTAPVLAPPVVEDEEDVALLRHVRLPGARAPVPGGLDVVGVRAAIDVDDGGILAARVEIHRLDHAPVECRAAVGGEDGALLEQGLIPTLPRVFGRAMQRLLARLRVADGAGTRHVGFRPGVDEVAPVGGELCGVASAAVVDEGALLGLQVEAVDVALQVARFLGDDDGALRGGAEADEFLHDPLAAGELAQLAAVGVHEVQVGVAILPAPVDELRVVPGQEGDAVERLDVLVGTFLAQGLCLAASRGIVGIERRVVLVAVELVEIECAAVGCPADVGEIAVGGVAQVEVGGPSRREGEDADGHFVRRHAGHRVLVRSQRCLALERVDLRIVGHHALVHAVEGELLPVGAPEGSLVDAELIPVDALPIDYFARAVFRELMLRSVGRLDEQVMVAEEGDRSGGLAELQLSVVAGALLCVEVHGLAFDGLARLGVHHEGRLLGGIDEAVAVPA